MTRPFVFLPVDWRSVGKSALSTVLLTTAAGLRASGKGLYLAGVALQHLGEELSK